jgi:BarA-like signal transduction histidine kinase
MNHRHSWHDWEMIDTLKIARLPRVGWHAEISSLTARIRQRTDPNMGSDRVETAVEAAVNLIAGVPDSWPRASNRLRQLYAQGH